MESKKYINGLSEYYVDIKQHIQLEKSDVFELGNSGNSNMIQLNFKNFKPGSVVALKLDILLFNLIRCTNEAIGFRFSLSKGVQQEIAALHKSIGILTSKETNLFMEIIDRLTLADLNRVLYRCDQEERDDGKGFNAYDVPNFRALVYCGFQGFMSLLSVIRTSNDLGHPMCDNLRNGNWMIG